jgi:hypothetical protein
MTTKLKKGSMYCAIADGLINFGTYIGKMPERYLFKASPFAFDYGVLRNGIRFEDIDNWILIEIPSPASQTEDSAFSYLQKVLPE